MNILLKKTTLIFVNFFIGLFLTTNLAAKDIVTTIKPLESLVHMVVGDKHSVGNIINQKSVHVGHLRPSQIALINNASVVFYIDDKFEIFLPKVIQNSRNKGKFFNIASNLDIDLIKNNPDHDEHDEHHDEHDEQKHHGKDEEHEDRHEEHEEEHEEHHEEHDEHHEEHDEHGDEHDHGAYDAHIWLDINIAKLIVDYIAKTMSDIYPHNKNFYDDNVDKAIAKLTKLNNEINAKFRSAKPNNFFIFHNAYNYFLRNHNLTDLLLFSVDNHDLSIKKMQTVVSLINNNQAKCMFSDGNYSARVINYFKNNTDVAYVELDPIGERYASNDKLYFNLLNDMADNIVNNCFE